jgi:hypothetical protein
VTRTSIGRYVGRGTRVMSAFLPDEPGPATVCSRRRCATTARLGTGLSRPRRPSATAARPQGPKAARRRRTRQRTGHKGRARWMAGSKFLRSFACRRWRASNSLPRAAAGGPGAAIRTTPLTLTPIGPDTTPRIACDALPLPRAAAPGFR